jgi:cytidine deaminase
VEFTPDTRALMLQAAEMAAADAYAPYSRFRVGAAVLADGVIFRGCNVENASSGLGICAERAAIFAAVTAGRRRLTAVAIAFADLGANAATGHRMPCGACRQVMAEFGSDDLVIATAGVPDMTLGTLLPNAFRLSSPDAPS